MSETKKTTSGVTAQHTKNAPSPELFTEALGIACWLMSMSSDHKSLPMSALEARVLPALLLKQFKVFKKDKMPVAFLTWALVSDDVKLELGQSGKIPELTQWRAGKNLVVVDCVSPFAPSEKLIEGFLAKMSPKTNEKSE